MKGEKHMEYSNLIGEIAKAHINYVDIAKRLGITRDTLRAKITGKSSFTVEEAFTIKMSSSPTVSLSSFCSVGIIPFSV